jgi:hypothetical protein
MFLLTIRVNEGEDVEVIVVEKGLSDIVACLVSINELLRNVLGSLNTCQRRAAKPYFGMYIPSQ